MTMEIYDITKPMISKKKENQLIEALKQISRKTIIISGPTKSGKTIILNKILKLLNLEIEYIPNITKYRGKLLSKKIAYTELDIVDGKINNQIIKNKICNTINLIIETRSANLYRYVDNCIHIHFKNNDFFHYLGKLFYGKSDANMYFCEKMVFYVFENYVEFLDMEEAMILTDLISLGEWYSVLYYFWKCKKKNLKKFYSFKSPSFNENT